MKLNNLKYLGFVAALGAASTAYGFTDVETRGVDVKSITRGYNLPEGVEKDIEREFSGKKDVSEAEARDYMNKAYAKFNKISVEESARRLDATKVKVSSSLSSTASTSVKEVTGKTMASETCGIVKGSTASRETSFDDIEKIATQLNPTATNTEVAIAAAQSSQANAAVDVELNSATTNLVTFYASTGKSQEAVAKHLAETTALVIGDQAANSADVKAGLAKVRADLALELVQIRDNPKTAEEKQMSVELKSLQNGGLVARSELDTIDAYAKRMSVGKDMKMAKFTLEQEKEYKEKCETALEGSL